MRFSKENMFVERKEDMKECEQIIVRVENVQIELVCQS